MASGKSEELLGIKLGSNLNFNLHLRMCIQKSVKHVRLNVLREAINYFCKTLHLEYLTGF